jgi:hypothetical protein
MNETDTELRADGQHTSQILAACEPALFPADLNVTITTYRVDSTADLSDLFDLFDNPISARTNTDKMGVYVADYEDLAAVDRAFLAKTARGIDYYLRDTSNPEDAARTALVLHSSRNHGLYFNEAQNRNFALWLYQWRGARHAWMISKPGLVAEMFADWRNYPSIAETFWSQVFTESNPDPNDDTRELASTLKDWVRKSPSPKQNKLRARAKKIWDRYRRQMAQIQRAA